MQEHKKQLDHLKVLYAAVSKAICDLLEYENKLNTDDANPFSEMLKVQSDSNLRLFTALLETMERSHVVIDIMKEAPKDFLKFELNEKGSYMKKQLDDIEMEMARENKEKKEPIRRKRK
jgi:glycerol-3-phosphate O-acyltransferase